MATANPIDILVRSFDRLGLGELVRPLIMATTPEEFAQHKATFLQGLQAQQAAGALKPTDTKLLDKLVKTIISDGGMDPDDAEEPLRLFHDEALKVAGVPQGKVVRGTSDKEGADISDVTSDKASKVVKAGQGVPASQQESILAKLDAKLEAMKIRATGSDFAKQQGWDLSTKMGIEQAKGWLTLKDAAGKGAKTGKAAALDLTPSFRAKLGPLGVTDIGGLGELTAHGQLPPELVDALNAHATGDPEALRTYLQSTPNVPPEVVAAAQARKSLQGVPEQFAQLKQKLQEAERTIGESGLLSEKKKLVGIRQLLGEAEKAEASGDPQSMKQLLERATKNPGLKQFFGDLPTREGLQQRLSDIKAAAEEGNTLGFGASSANTAEQNLARLRKAAEQLKSGAKGAAADLLEGPAKFGESLPLVENLTKAAKGTKIAPDVAKSVAELKALLAEGEPGIKAWMARAGGVKGVLKGPIGIGVVLPLLFEAYQRMSASTDQRRQQEEIALQRESLPTVQNLLETYKAQRFAQQGVNNEAPDPRIVQALQQMGPQLTNSEVAIGPDRTMDNVLALRERLMQE